MAALIRTAFAGAALALAAGAASAQECPAEPAFVGVTGSNSDVRASASYVERADWGVAQHFATEAIDSGTSSRNKAAAYINLCAALANQRDAGTSDACEAAVTRNPESWEAFTNRGAAFWLAGDQEAASAEFARAAELAADEAAVQTNSALISCAS
jgi:Flp pilus assembly protein TadD